MSSDEPRRRRLFFALWPDDATRKRLAALARKLPRRRGRPVPVGNLHITLAFAGAVERQIEDCLRAGAADIHAERFVLRLTRIGYFARSRILWFGADAHPHELAHLVDRLRECLANCGLRPDVRTYRPHVTLLRNAEPAPRDVDVAPVDWPVHAFHLIESRTRSEGAEYEVLREFELRN